MTPPFSLKSPSEKPGGKYLSDSALFTRFPRRLTPLFAAVSAPLLEMAATSVRRSLEMPTPFAVLPPAVLSPDLAPSARASQPTAMARRHTRMLSATVRVRPHLDGAGDMRRALNNVHAHNMRKRHRWAILIATHAA